MLQDLYEAFSGNGSRDDIFKALSGTYKALLHSYETSEEDNSGDKICYIFEPIILIKGKLFEVFLDEDSLLQVEESNYCQLCFNYLSPNYQHKRFIAHVVTLAYLPNFIAEKEKSLNDIFMY